MKFSEITESASAGATGSGSVASVSAPLSTQTRKGGNLLSGKKTKKKYANSVDARKQMNVSESRIAEEEVTEQEVLVVPGMRKRKDTSFISRADDRRDHEVEMARTDLYALAKNAQTLYKLIKDRSEDEGLMGWQQSYITLASDYINSVKESIEHDVRMQEASEYGQGEDDRINTGNILDKKPKGPNRVGIQGGEITGTSLAEGEERSQLRDAFKDKMSDWLATVEVGEYSSEDELKDAMVDYAEGLTHSDLDTEHLDYFISDPIGKNLGIGDLADDLLDYLGDNTKKELLGK